MFNAAEHVRDMEDAVHAQRVAESIENTEATRQMMCEALAFLLARNPEKPYAWLFSRDDADQLAWMAINPGPEDA